MNYPRISIVTPSYNSGKFLEATILSVIEQNYPNIDYIIIDGGSTDSSLEIIKKYEKHLSYWVSEKDNGLYDALNKGFSRSTGDLMGWLNADDMLHQGALFVISEIFSSHSQIEWLQGYPTVMDALGRIVFHRPARYSKYAFYLKDYHDGTYIQQESTYWRRDLWERSGGRLTDEHRYAGDFELWMRFYQHAEMYITPALIGAFRMHGPGQISSVNYADYLTECDSIVDYYLTRIPKDVIADLQKLVYYRRISKYLPLRKIKYIRKFLHERLDSPNAVSFDFKTQRFLS